VTILNCSLTPILHPQRGVCRRCGWNGDVSQIPLTDLRHLKSAVAFGQICDECARDLFSSRCGPQVSVGRACMDASGPRTIGLPLNASTVRRITPLA
jgi:hypothetical protein